MQKIRKILRAVSEIFKDGRTNGLTDGLTDMGDYIGPLSGKPGVHNKPLGAKRIYGMSAYQEEKIYKHTFFQQLLS